MVLPIKLVKKYDLLISKTSKSIPSLDQLILAKFIESGKYSSYVNRLRTSFLNKKKMVLSIINKTDLNVLPVENYSSILIELDKKIDIKKLKNEFEKSSIKINFINDFMRKEVNKIILIIGFSSIDINLINEGIELIIKTISNSLIK
jgi:GntR family transcriptional regulator/MocR family aminotransferase